MYEGARWVQKTLFTKQLSDKKQNSKQKTSRKTLFKVLKYK